MKSHQLMRIGAILFFLGLIFLFIAWRFTYPIHITESNDITFTQFSVLVWPGLLFSLMGLFFVGYYSERKGIKAICASLFPVILYVYVFYFSYPPTSDSGAVKSMFEVFHHINADSSVIPYFQYPSYFTLNEITMQISGIYVNDVAHIFFALYGVLLGLFLYLFLFKETKNDSYQIGLIAVFLYFTTSFSYLNYQWVPQTLALVFFFILLITFNREGLQYKLINFVLFTALVFTHSFIPVIFLLFFGLYCFKKREQRHMFIIMACIFLSVLIFYTTYYFPQIVAAFKETIYGLGEYTIELSRSFKDTTGFFDQFLSLINRIRIPLTFGVVSIGFLILLIKKKISHNVTILGIVGVCYLFVGMMYPVLGLRALQVLIAALVLGIGFFIVKQKKLTVAFVFVIVLLSIFGPMRSSYDQTQFLVSEEEHSLQFLATTISDSNRSKIVVDQVMWGYFSNIDNYLNPKHTIALRPSKPEFYEIFNLSIDRNNYVVYDTNLIKEIKGWGFVEDNSTIYSKVVLVNNKIYQCGKTSILTGT